MANGCASSDPSRRPLENLAQSTLLLKQGEVLAPPQADPAARFAATATPGAEESCL